MEALVAAAPRYAVVVMRAGAALPLITVADLHTVEDVPGSSGTDFGVPSTVTDDDRRPVTAKEAGTLAGLVEACWATFDEVAASAPATLRKGPRGGGRDTAKILAHVTEADHAYAREIGIKQAPEATDEAVRAAMLNVLGLASDGSPLGGRRWPLRYAARRIAWHALDHAWEIEDRTEINGG
jgi:hypothetical protein